MGLFASVTLYARNRDGSHCAADYRKAQAGKQRQWQCWACACLIAVGFAHAAFSETIRIAYYHTELSRDGPGLLLRGILKEDEQVAAFKNVVSSVSPDVLVLGDIDYDLNGHSVRALADLFEDYDFVHSMRPNRGLHLGRDLNGNGYLGDPQDAEGYADFSGQGGMAVLSRHPIDQSDIRDFTTFRWAELPSNLMPPDIPAPQRLSTTAHWEIPVTMPNGGMLHLLAWHGTTPVFDGPEDLNGRRNHDETRFWQLFIEGALPFTPPQDFVVLGTANSDPFDGDSRHEAIQTILSHPLIQDPLPQSDGAVSADRANAGANQRHLGPAALDTVDWRGEAGFPGNLRVDYVLPSRTLHVKASGVFWPEEDALFGGDVRRASRHRLVWVDIEMSNGLVDGNQRIGVAE